MERDMAIIESNLISRMIRPNCARSSIRRPRSYRLAVVFLIGAILMAVNAHAQQQPRPGQQMKWATGTVKEFSSGSIALSDARDTRDPRSQPVDMTFAITADTQTLYPQVIRAGTTVVVHYFEQDGKLFAISVAYFGAANGRPTIPQSGASFPAQNPYGAAVPPPAANLPRMPTQTPQPASGSARGCAYTAGPCIQTPGPQLLPPDTGHDFNSVLRQADAIAKEHPGARLYHARLNYRNDQVWDAEFEYATEPDGRKRNARWADFVVHIDPVVGRVSQYQSVTDFRDETDEPPPPPPSTLASPSELMRTVAVSPDARLAGGVDVVLCQVGATNRMVRARQVNGRVPETLESIGQAVPAGKWIWVADVRAFGQNGVVTADAENGRIACYAGGQVTSCANISAQSQVAAKKSGTQKFQCNEQGKNCRPVN